MDSIAITKPNMGALPQDRQGLSPFGILSQAFFQELLARAGFEEGRWPFVPLDLLEEGEEAPASAPPVQAVAQIDLRLVLQNIRQLDMRTEKGVERVVERIIRLREQGRPHSAAVQPIARGDGRKEVAGQKNQPSGPEAAGEGRAQGRVRGGSRQAVPGPGGGKHAAQTPESVVSAAGSFAHLQNFYNTINQHLQFIANIRESDIWRPNGPTPPQEAPSGLNRCSEELFRRAHGLRREQGRLPVPAAVPVGIPSLAGAAVSLAVGSTSDLPRSDTVRRDAGPLTAGEQAGLEDGTGSAAINGAADAAAGSRGIRREARRLEQAIDAQALRPNAWKSMLSARTFYPDARESMLFTRMFHPDAQESMCFVRTLHPDAWAFMLSVRTLHPDARQSAPSARMLRRDAWNAMLGLDLWKQGAGGEMSGQEKAAGGPPQSIPQRPWEVEGPILGSGKAALAPHRGISAIETAAPVGRAHWGKDLWSISPLSAISGQPGTEDQAVSVFPRDAPVPVPPIGGDLAHRIGPEEEGLPRQAASEAEPVERSVLGDRTGPAAAVQSAPMLHSRTVLGPGGLTAREASPMGADAAAQANQPAADSGRVPSMSLEEVRQNSSARGTWPRTGNQEEPILPPFSEMPGGELAHRAAPIDPEWDFGSGPSTGRAQTSANRTRISVDKAQTSAGGTRISSDIPVWPLEAADAAKQGQAPQANPAAAQSKPLVSALRDIRTVKTEQSFAESGEASPRGTYQTGESLSALFGPGAGLIHLVDLYRDSVPVPAEDGARAAAALTAQAKEQGFQADSPQRKTRRAKPASQTGGQRTQSGFSRGQVQIGAVAGPIGRAEGIAALRHTPLTVNRRQGSLAASPRVIRPFAPGRKGGLPAGVEAPEESRSAALYHGVRPPKETIYGVQSEDTAGAGTGTRTRMMPDAMGRTALDAVNRAAPDPLELTYGSTARHPAADAPAAGGQELAQGLMESDYVRSLPDWAKRFLREGAPQTREEAVRRLDTGREQAMGTARSIAALPSFSEETGTTFQWSAPDPRAPAPVEYRERPQRQEQSQSQSIRISEAEVQRTADRVYQMIEERIRRERHRLGL